MSDVDLLICDEEGHVLLATDESLAGKVVSIPKEIFQEVLEKGSMKCPNCGETLEFSFDDEDEE